MFYALDSWSIDIASASNVSKPLLLLLLGYAREARGYVLSPVSCLSSQRMHPYADSIRQAHKLDNKNTSDTLNIVPFCGNILFI